MQDSAGRHIFLFDLAVELSMAERELREVQRYGGDATDVAEAKERFQELRQLMNQAKVKDLIEDLKLILNRSEHPRYDKSHRGERLLYRYKSNW